MIWFPRSLSHVLAGHGLIDKNQYPISEGDIIKYRLFGSDEYSLVKWDNERTGFLPFIGVDCGYKWIHVKPEVVEVVGNRFDEPKLLDLVKQSS